MNPAIAPEIDEQGTQCWYRDGLLHREDGPAVIFDDDESYWYREGDKITRCEFKLRDQEVRYFGPLDGVDLEEGVIVDNWLIRFPSKEDALLFYLKHA